MRENKYMHRLLRSFWAGLVWCLFATMPFGFSFADADAESQYTTRNSFYVAPVRLKNQDWEALDKNYLIQWKLEAGLREFRRTTDSSTIFASALKTNLQYRFADELSFFGTFSYFFQTGSSQSRYGDLSPNSGVFVDDAFMNWALLPREIFSVEVGALNQGRTIDNPVFIKGSAFPGISEKLKLEWGKFRFLLRAQQLIPYSQTQEVELVEAEETPRLNTQSLGIKWRDTSDEVELLFGFFDYSRLPSTVANASRILGNTVDGQDLNAEFTYDFKGWFANFEWSSIFADRVKMEFDARLLENSEAIEKRNRAQEFGGALGYLRSGTHYYIRGGVFSIEADAAPAFYNSSTLGNNNRDGWRAGLLFEIRKYEDVRLSFDYVDSQVLNENIFQEDQQFYYVGLQTRFRGL